MFNWEFPYASQRMPVLAKNVVATSQPLAAQAGLQMLHRGGNAVDAALAAAITLTVVEPTSNGIGSDSFAIIWDGKQLTGMNASGRSPAGWTPERFASHKTMPALGWDAVTVPGCVSAWDELSKKYGKLPFEQLFEYAIKYAREGYMVSPITALSWARQAPERKQFSEFSWTFLPKDRAPYAGERFYCPQQAETLEEIARTRGESFYRGALAERIALASKSEGGAMTAEDLAAHQLDWVEPISIDYRGYRLHEIPPNGHGIASLTALGILSHFDVASHAPDSADSFHLQIEAMKLGFADAWRTCPIPSTMQSTVAELLDAAISRAREADRHEARAASEGRHPEGRRHRVPHHGRRERDDGLADPVQLHGLRLGRRRAGHRHQPAEPRRGLQARAGHPNQVGPRKRPYHTIIPGFLTRDGAPVMSFGVMGGMMQPQGHLQMVVRLVDYNQNPQACTDAPRWIVNPDYTICVEDRMPASVTEELVRRGHKIVPPEVPMFGFGGAQLIHRIEDGYLAASDHRKDGCAIGF
jgi:gamma-glutamyltranspeptidase/glutathione hydrolase